MVTGKELKELTHLGVITGNGENEAWSSLFAVFRLHSSPDQTKRRNLSISGVLCN